MSFTDEAIATTMKAYLGQHLLGGKTEDFTNDSHIISCGLSDSVSTLQMVDFIEKSFGIEFQPHEVDVDNLDTIKLITAFVQKKLG